MGTHGFARVKSWEIKEIVPVPDGSVSVRFRLPNFPEAGAYPSFVAEYVVTVNEGLTLELIVTNNATDEKLEFEECLHTYFSVEDIGATSIVGLKGISYLDKVANFAKKTETDEAIRVFIGSGPRLFGRERHGGNSGCAVGARDSRGEGEFRIDGGVESVDCEGAADARFGE